MAELNSQQLIDKLKHQLASLDLPDTSEHNIGTVIQVGDGVAKLSGLSGAMYGEIIDFGHGVTGLILNLLENSVDAIIMGDFIGIKAGDQARATGKILEVPVGETLIGRTVDGLGNPLDNKGDLKTATYYPVEKIAPGIIDRQSVTVPLATGIKAIDTLTPIGRGQRELIIGDRNTGKSSIAITTILNQKGQDVICIYVPIGQKKAFIAQTVEIFRASGAMDYTIVVAAAASDPVTNQYLAPYAGTAMAEYFMDQGKDVLIVYDDLSKHAWAYREVSLLMRRPAGREAYPGDVFYLHSRLLERSCRLSNEKGGGSITSLPIIETQAGDVSAYIPTNVISITDGQIYLEPGLFNSGIRPAINTGLSVSRVGNAAQTKAIKQVSGTMKLELAQYRELQAFSQFSSDLDADTKARLDKGARITEVLKQNWDRPYSQGEQVLVIWAVNNGHLQAIPADKVTQWETSFLEHAHLKYEKLINELNQTRDKLTDKQIQELTKLVTNFNKTIGSSLKD